MRHAAVYDEDEIPSGGAELNLGMGTLLGIFFGLALVCGVFFGFGYTMGHRAPGPYVSSEPLYQAPTQSAPLATPKPSALMPEQPSQVVLPVTAPASVPASTEKAEVVVPEPAPHQKPVLAPVAPPKPNLVQASSTTTPAPAALPPTVASGAFVVQIAAVKNRSDAEALANALRKNGFSPSVRSESQDKLLHVQIGPFANRDDAKAMRQRLSGAGYDAFIK